jgi:hypothetical protein
VATLVLGYQGLEVQRVSVKVKKCESTKIICVFFDSSMRNLGNSSKECNGKYNGKLLIHWQLYRPLVLDIHVQNVPDKSQEVYTIPPTPRNA